MKRFLKGVFLVGVVFLVACPGGPTPLPGDVRPARFHLIVLHTNDFHGADYGCLARISALIRKMRGAEKNVIYLDAGDEFTRGPYQHLFQGELEFAVLNAIGCRAFTLGNNEFKAAGAPETAQKFLFERIRQAEFPVLCANVREETDGRYLEGVKPYTVLEAEGVRIGILGLSADRIRGYDQSRGFIVDELVAAARKIAPAVAAESDIVLALTHIGFDDDCRLANAGTAIQAIIGGDSHTVLRKPFVEKDTPIVQAGDSGSYLGRLDLEFELVNGKYLLRRFTGILIPIDPGLPEDAEIKALIESYLRKTKPAEKEAA